MSNSDASSIYLNEPTGTYLSAFAAKHRIYTLEELLAYPLSALWKMEGFNLHTQNEILDLVKLHGLTASLKQE